MSGLYKWLFYLATVRHHVVKFRLVKFIAMASLQSIGPIVVSAIAVFRLVDNITFI